MNELITDIKKLQSDTLDNLKIQNLQTPYAHIELTLQILWGFVIDII